MKYIKYILGSAIAFFGVSLITYGAVTFSPNLLPLGNGTQDLGSSTPALLWKALYVNDVKFFGEIQPDGSTCADGEILKKTGTNDWDCATDATGGGGSGGSNWQFSGSNAITPTTTVGIIVNHASSSVVGLSIVRSTTTQATTTNLDVVTQLKVETLTSALTITGATGVFAEYTGTTCTNQFVRSLSALGVATCEGVVSADVSGLDISADTNLAVTWPITLTGDTVGFNGLSTSTAAVIGNLPYFSGVNTFANVATTSVTISSGLSYSGTFGAVVGGVTGTLTCATGSSSVFGCLTAANFNVFNNKVGTSSSETANNIAYFTSTSATPPLIGSEADFTYVATTDTLTVVNASLTNATSTGTFTLPVGASPTITSDGQCAIDTTSGQFKCDVGGETDVFVAERFPVFGYSTTTSALGTTTLFLGPAPLAQTWNTIRCDSSSFVGVSVYDGTNRMNYFIASATIGTITLSTNNSFTAGEARRVDIGTSTAIAGGFTIGCSAIYDIDAD